jgi:hypothetical protein
VYGDPLLAEEESREKHLSAAAQMPDQNKPKGWVDFAVYMAELDFGNMTHFSYELYENELQLLISVRRPVGVRKRLRDQTNLVRSPFNMHTQNQFLNYWNVKQSFYMRGIATKDFKKILELIVKENPSIKISDRLTASFLSKNEIVEQEKILNSRSVKFLCTLNQLQLSLRYSIFALLSCNKVSIFNESLVKFMRDLQN